MNGYKSDRYTFPQFKKNEKHYQVTEKDLGKIFNHPTKAIFGGDFNARSTNWGDSSDNVNGKIIWEFLKNSEFNIHASTSPTCFRSIDGSYIDFFISKEIDSRQKCFAFPSFSDHHAIFLNYACESTQNSSPLRLVKQYNLVNVRKMNEFIHNKLMDINIPQNCNLSNDNIDEIADKIDLMFWDAIEKFVPKTQIPIGNIILSNQTKALNKKFRTISRKKFRNRFNPDNTIRINFNLIKNIYINSIRCDINSYYKNYMLDINSNLNVFEAVRRLTKHNKKNYGISKLYRDKEKTLSIDSPDQICEEFADMFEKITC